MKNSHVVNVDKLNDDLFAMMHDHPELLDDFLLEEGYDPKKLEKDGISKAKSLLFKHKVTLKRNQQETLYAKAIAVFESAKASTKEAILQLLQQRAPRLQFRNLEKMDENDLKEILNESDLLDLMDKIEKNELL